MNESNEFMENIFLNCVPNIIKCRKQTYNETNSLIAGTFLIKYEKAQPIHNIFPNNNDRFIPFQSFI